MLVPGSRFENHICKKSGDGLLRSRLFTQKLSKRKKKKIKMNHSGRNHQYFFLTKQFRFCSCCFLVLESWDPKRADLAGQAGSHLNFKSILGPSILLSFLLLTEFFDLGQVLDFSLGFIFLPTKFGS